MADVSSAFGAYPLKPFAQKMLSMAQSMPANWFGRRGALLCRKIVLKQKYKIVDALVDGLKLRLYMTDNVSERKFLFLPQFFDRFERKILKERLSSGDVFVDVGANAGIYTLTAAALVGVDGQVLSIEPNPAVLDRLTFNMALNGFEPQMRIEQAGVSDADGMFDLVFDDTNLGGSSLVNTRSDRKISVRCAPLLSIVQKHGLSRIDAMKVDIEGAEDRALIPFLTDAPLSLHPKVLILENSPMDWKQDLPAALRAAGYDLMRITRMNMVWEKKEA